MTALMGKEPSRNAPTAKRPSRNVTMARPSKSHASQEQSANMSVSVSDWILSFNYTSIDPVLPRTAMLTGLPAYVNQRVLRAPLILDASLSNGTLAIVLLVVGFRPSPDIEFCEPGSRLPREIRPSSPLWSKRDAGVDVYVARSGGGTPRVRIPSCTSELMSPSQKSIQVRCPPNSIKQITDQLAGSSNFTSLDGATVWVERRRARSTSFKGHQSWSVNASIVHEPLARRMASALPSSSVGLVTMYTMGTSRGEGYNYFDRVNFTAAQIQVALARLDAFLAYYLDVLHIDHVLLFVEVTPPWHFEQVARLAERFGGRVTCSPVFAFLYTFQSELLTIGLQWMRSRTRYTLFIDHDEYVFLLNSWASLSHWLESLEPFQSVLLRNRFLLTSVQASGQRAAGRNSTRGRDWNVTASPLSELDRLLGSVCTMLGREYPARDRSKYIVHSNSSVWTVFTHWPNVQGPILHPKINAVHAEQNAFFMHMRTFCLEPESRMITDPPFEPWAPYDAVRKR